MIDVRQYLPAKRKTILCVLNTATRRVEGMYYLYRKTHNKTGLKYLGQTSRDPFNYLGSGKRWLNHINKHGNDVTTDILFESKCKKQLKDMGLYYSKKYNVVSDRSWANLVEEQGTGGDTSKTANFINAIKMRDYSHKKDTKYLQKISKRIKKMWEEKFSDPNFDIAEYKKMCSNRSKRMWESRGITEDDRKIRSKKQKEYLSKPGVKENLSKKSKENWLKISKTYEVTFPDGHKEIIKCFRGWCKERGLPYYKLYNTLRNGRPSKDGWQVKIIDS